MQEQTEKQNIKISVRNLVEFILRSGDIDNRKSRVMQAEAMQEGSRIHRKDTAENGCFLSCRGTVKNRDSKRKLSVCDRGTCGRDHKRREDHD